jgi:type IV secretion system VirB5/TraC/TraE/TrbJ family protein
MRKVLLATVAVVALALPHQAYAVYPVHDATQIAQNAIELARWVEQLASMKQQYDQLVRTYNALSHATDLRSTASALGGLTRNYFPEANAIPELMRDASNLWGRGAYYNYNDMYYTSNVINKWGDRWNEEMERRMAVTSNAKAMAEAATYNAEDHVFKLDMLRARLEAATDVTEVSAVNGLIALEQQNLDAHRAQIQNVALLLEAEERVTLQRDEQMQRESADLLFLSTSPITDTLR